MIQALKLSMARPFFILAGLELILLMGCFYAGVVASWVEYEPGLMLLAGFLPQAAIFAGVLSISMFAVGLYEGLLNTSVARILVRFGVAFCAGFIVLSAIFYAVPDFATWRAVTAWAMVLALAVIIFVHIGFMKFANLAPFKRRVLVLGTGRWAERIEELERRGQAFGFVCLGFVKTSNPSSPVVASNIISPTQPLIQLVGRLRAQEIVVADEDQQNSGSIDQLVECSFRGVPIIDYATFWERETKRTDLDALAENWILAAGGLPAGIFHHVVMRLFDFSVSAVFTVFMLPVIAATAIAIKLDSSGPIFYRQSRVGLRGKPFDLLKFRSMRIDAEADGVPRWSSQNDPRVTAVGAFLRKTRIDEIPQILNVLRGDMKFVGPRPERPYFVEQLAQKIPFYRQRFQVKPGITGWAQVHYPYAASTEDARGKLEYDLYYIKNYGLMLDLVIILQTIRVIFWPHKMIDAEIKNQVGSETSMPTERM